MKKISMLFVMFLSVFSIMFTNLSVLSTDGNAYAASGCTVGDNGLPSDGCTIDKTSGKGVNEKIYTFGSTIAGVVVGFALLMIIYGGFKYVTSQGDPKATESAKSQIMFAAIGMLIVMMAFVILKLFVNGIS